MPLVRSQTKVDKDLARLRKRIALDRPGKGQDIVSGLRALQRDKAPSGPHKESWGDRTDPGGPYAVPEPIDPTFKRPDFSFQPSATPFKRPDFSKIGDPGILEKGIRPYTSAGITDDPVPPTAVNTDIIEGLRKLQSEERSRPASTFGILPTAAPTSILPVARPQPSLEGIKKRFEPPVRYLDGEVYPRRYEDLQPAPELSLGDLTKRVGATAFKAPFIPFEALEVPAASLYNLPEGFRSKRVIPFSGAERKGVGAQIKRYREEASGLQKFGLEAGLSLGIPATALEKVVAEAAMKGAGFALRGGKKAFDATILTPKRTAYASGFEPPSPPGKPLEQLSHAEAREAVAKYPETTVSDLALTPNFTPGNIVASTASGQRTYKRILEVQGNKFLARDVYQRADKTWADNVSTNWFDGVYPIENFTPVSLVRRDEAASRLYKEVQAKTKAKTKAVEDAIESTMTVSPMVPPVKTTRWAPLKGGRLIQTTIGGQPAWSNGFLMEVGTNNPFPKRIKTEFTVLKPKMSEPLWNPAVVAAKTKVEPIGIRIAEGKESVLFESGQSRIAVDRLFIDYFRNRYKNITFWMDRHDRALVIKDGGKNVGMVMPLLIPEERLAISAQMLRTGKTSQDIATERIAALQTEAESQVQRISVGSGATPGTPPTAPKAPALEAAQAEGIEAGVRPSPTEITPPTAPRVAAEQPSAALRPLRTDKEILSELAKLDKRIARYDGLLGRLVGPGQTSQDYGTVVGIQIKQWNARKALQAQQGILYKELEQVRARGLQPPRAEAPLPTPTAKQPWQMTRAEFAVDRTSRLSSTKERDAITRLLRVGRRDSQGVLTVSDRQIINAAEAVGMVPGELRRIDTVFANIAQVGNSARFFVTKRGVASQLGHKGVVTKALAEGKPVPPEVLREYPDLVRAAPEPPTPPRAAVQQPPPVEAPSVAQTALKALLATPPSPKPPAPPRLSSTKEEDAIRRLLGAKSPLSRVGRRGRRPTSPVTVPGSGPPSGGLAGVMRMWKEPPLKPPGKDYGTVRLMLEEKLLDRFAGINKLSTRLRQLLRVKELPPELDAELHTALLGGGAEAGFQRSVDASEAMLRALGKGIDTDYVNTYLHLRHAIDIEAMKGTQRMIAGGIQGADEANRLLVEMATKLGPEQSARVLKAAEVIRDHYADILARKVKSGLVSKELAEQLRTQYPWYNPIAYIERLAAEGSGIREPQSVISATRGGLRRLSEIGSEAARERPLDTMPRATLEAELLIRRNDAAKAIIRAAQQDPKLRTQIKKISGTRPVAQVEGEAIYRRPPGEIPGTVSFLENGQRQLWEVPPWLEREMKLLGQMQTGDLERIARLANAVPRASFTGANPVFFIGNFAVDTMTAMLTQGVMPGRIVGRLLKNLKTLRQTDPVMAEFLRQGGGISGYSGRTPEQIAKSVQKQGQIAIRTPADWKALLGKPLDAIFRVGHAVEMAPRLATYETLLKRGATPARAAFAGRRVTIDFNRAGTAIRQANSLFLYLNAGVQGAALPFRALRDSPRARYWMAGFMAAIVANYAWNRQFEEYKDVPFHIKYGALTIMLPSNEYDKRGNKEPHYITIVPNLREFAFFSGSLLYIMNRLDSDAPDDFEEVLRAWGAGLNPLGSIIGTSGLPVPTQIGETAVELMLNRDVFRDRPIVPPDLEGLPSDQQFNAYTSESLRRIGQTIGVSPMKLQHFMRGVFGGLGWQIIGGMDATIHKAAPEPVEPRIADLLSQLQEIKVPTVPPERVSLERSKFLSKLSVEDRDKLLELERKPEPRMPFISDLVRKIYRTRGGQAYRTGQELAERESGLSANQTANVGRILGKVAQELDRAEEVFARGVETGQLEVSKGQTIAYDRTNWREDHSENGKLYRGALLALGIIYPSAAQVQKDGSAWGNYQAQAYTLAGMVPDTRLRGQLLVASYRAIQPEGVTPSTMNWDDFFNRRQQFMDGLEVPDRELLREHLTARMNDIEREYEADQATIRPYWDVDQQLLGTAPLTNLPKMSRLWQQYLDASPMEKDRLRPGVAKVLELLRERRDAMIIKNSRTDGPSIEVALLKWGYRKAAITRQGRDYQRGERPITAPPLPTTAPPRPTTVPPRPTTVPSRPRSTITTDIEFDWIEGLRELQRAGR